jgi:hypothetical protein
MRAPLATRSNMEGGGSSASKDLLAKVKAASSDKGVSEMKEVRLCSFCTTAQKSDMITTVLAT